MDPITLTPSEIEQRKRLRTLEWLAHQNKRMLVAIADKMPEETRIRVLEIAAQREP